ncbi:MAG: hypothetical protein ACK4TL_03890 [Hyphomicrobiaceae bacterium]
MHARPLDLPAAFARIWIDSSIQMMRATAELWSGLLSPAPARSVSSTASPWWMPPQQPRATVDVPRWPAALAVGAWVPLWPQTLPLSGLAGASPFLPWLPAERTASGSNPFALWQQLWLEAATPSLPRPWQAGAAPVAGDMWQPIAAAYRTANGHAMAAMLRTMADVVEPRPAGTGPAHYWPRTLGTRH